MLAIARREQALLRTRRHLDEFAARVQRDIAHGDTVLVESAVGERGRESGVVGAES